jgi:hypothetical protein
MVDIRVSIGRRYEIVHEDRLIATREYVEYLRGLGYEVELEVIEYVQGVRGLGLVEVTVIYIGLKAADAAIGSVVNDVYESAKRLVKARYRELKRENRGGRHHGFSIRSEDDKELASWDTRQDEPAEGDEAENDETD